MLWLQILHLNTTVKRRNKILYIPGMITAIVLPILSIFYLKITGAFNNYRVIEINMPRETETNQIFEFKKSHHFKEFVFKKNNVSNNNISNQIDSYLQYLKNKNDTLNGIKINFGIQAKYSDLIGILNLLFKHEYETYLLEEDNLWILWNTPIIHEQYQPITGRVSIDTDQLPYFNCGTQDIIRSQRMTELQATNAAERELKFNSKIKELWVLGFAYILLIGISIRDYMNSRNKQVTSNTRQAS